MTNIYKRWIYTCQTGKTTQLKQLLRQRAAKYYKNIRMLNFIRNLWNILNRVIQKLKTKMHYTQVASRLMKNTGWSWSECLAICARG